ncbi:hypothetical protein KUTeg_014807 [Tegillarca granosa]|uniref:C2H2-type domain-containing protein n=1 Tax=Tegillarca granosa TaxID=220873 RepID=A0ABQ9EQX0_TEGGR|nr:hypothetical protein KUTeg_014807 [Tegillarca granosa]
METMVINGNNTENFTARDRCQRQNQCCGTLLQSLLNPRHATAVIYDYIGIVSLPRSHILNLNHFPGENKFFEAFRQENVSQISFDGINLPVGSQDLESLLEINTQDLLNVNLPSQEDSGEVESCQPLDVVGYEEEEDIIMNSDSDEELVAAMEENNTVTNEMPYSPVAGPSHHITNAEKELAAESPTQSPVAGHLQESEASTSKKINSHKSRPHVEKVYHCRRCPFTCSDKKQLYLHRMREHFQRGGSIHTRPWNDETEAPWHREDGSVDERLRDVYTANEPIILQNHDIGPVQSTYNFPIDNTLSVDQLMQQANAIYLDQQHSFRLNMSFGVILQNRVTGEYRYFTAYTNHVTFESPLFISKRSDLRQLELRLKRMDILAELLHTRPDTTWVPVLLCNVEYYITSTYYTIGAGSLPDYIINMRSITSLVTDYKGKPYKDQLCLLRCLALHNGYKVDNLKQPTDIYYEQWLNFNKSTKRFSGVALEEFPKFEECYKVNLEAYTITEEGYAFSVYKSRGRYESSMYVNLYQNHASYINNFATYAQKFQCQMCQRLFNRSNKLRVHQKTCTKQTTFKYPGGFHQAQLSIFDKLDEFGIHVSQKERTFEWFIVYDFEAMLQKTDQKQTDYLQWTAQHVPISVSICSNVEGYTDAMCFIDPNQERLVEQMIAAMSEISEKVIEMAGKKWEYVLKQLNEKIENSENKEDLKKLYASFQSYISQVPVLGFNSAKYDLNLIKKSIAKKLNLHDEGHAFVQRRRT